jgi:hypothetical protein
MSITYTPSTNFGAKDSLPTNDSNKVIRGSEFTTEFVAIQTAFSNAAPSASPTFTGTVTISSVDINGGTIDGVTIGGSSAGAGSFTTLTADGLTVGYDRAGVSGGFILYDDNQSENRLSLITGGGAGVNAVINQSGGAFNITDASINTIASFADSGDISFYEDTGTTPKFFWDASAEALTIGSSTSAGTSGSLLLENASRNQSITFTDGTSSFYLAQQTASNSYVTDGEAGAPVLWSVGKKIVFGTNAVVGQQSALVINTDNSCVFNGNITFRGDENTFISRAAADTLAFTTGGSERMRIDSSGNVGIGTSSPQERVTISTTGTSQDAVLQLLATNSNGGQSNGVKLRAVGAAGGSGAGTLAFDIRRTSFAYEEAMRIDSSGNLLVGTTATAAQNSNSFSYDVSIGYFAANHVNGTASGTGYMTFNYNGGLIGSITQNGTTGVLYNVSSDARLKENIADAEDAGAKVDAIQVRQFNWKADGSHQDYGMIAQELMTVAPEAVSGDPESDDMMGVDYSKLVPMMLKEIQSLRARVAQLEGV